MLSDSESRQPISFFAMMSFPNDTLHRSELGDVNKVYVFFVKPRQGLHGAHGSDHKLEPW